MGARRFHPPSFRVAGNDMENVIPGRLRSIRNPESRDFRVQLHTSEVRAMTSAPGRTANKVGRHQ